MAKSYRGFPPKPVTIYALVDPRTHLIRYVGASRSPERRYDLHRRDIAGTSQEKSKWIDDLDYEGFDPVMIEIEKTEVGSWGSDPAVLEVERKWIERISNAGHPLLNVQSS